MRTATGSLLIASLALVALASLATACADESPARLPENVTAAIVYNEHAERWHAGAIVFGDRPDSFLRVLCLTEAGKPEGDHGDEHTGINIDAQLGEAEGLRGFDWSWRIDGREWDGGRWSLSTTTSPATLVIKDAEMEAALLQELRGATTAELVGSKDGEEQHSVRFDVTALLNTPVQFAIDDCNADAIEERAGVYHSAYAYWIPESGRHSITLMDRDSATDRWLLLSCGPKDWTDDDAPSWIREAKGEVYAAVALMGFGDESSHSQDQADISTVESATVTWVGDDGEADTAEWDFDHGWLRPQSARDNLRFINDVRNSEELTITVEAAESALLDLRVQAAAILAKPLGAEFETCVQEYAALND